MKILMIVTALSLPQYVICQDKILSHPFPQKKVPTGFYCRPVTLSFPFLGHYLPAVQYGVGVPKGADTVALLHATRLSTSDSATINSYLLVVPPGQQLYVEFPDTRITLNAKTMLEIQNIKGSWTTFRLKGEAFFEVKDSATSVVVRADGAIIESEKGSSFNIFNYDGEDCYVAGLVKGTLKVKTDETEKLLRDSGVEVWRCASRRDLWCKSMDLQEITAWVKGSTRSNDPDFPFELRSLSRWYGVHFEFDKESLNFIKTAAFSYRHVILSEVIGAYKSLDPNISFHQNGLVITVKRDNSTKWHNSETDRKTTIKPSLPRF